MDNPPERPNPVDFDGVFVDGAWTWPTVSKNEVLRIVGQPGIEKELGRLFSRWARKKEYQAAQREWKHYQTWRKNRNPKRFVLEEKYGLDTKHAAHLFRLLLEAEDLLSQGHLELPLKKEHRDMFMKVLRGGLSYEQVLAYAKTADERFAEMEKVSPLPKFPDGAEAEKLLMDIHREWLGCRA